MRKNLKFSTRIHQIQAVDRLSSAVAAPHSNKAPPFLGACGKDGRLAGHVQSPKYVDARAPQGLNWRRRSRRPLHTWLQTPEADLIEYRI